MWSIFDTLTRRLESRRSFYYQAERERFQVEASRNRMQPPIV